MTEPTAAQLFRTAVQLSVEDSKPLRLKYHLRRLSVLGLTRDDEKALLELARIAFQDLDVAKKAKDVSVRKGASPLAQVLASVVEQAATGGHAHPRAIMLGAVLGAYAGTGAHGDDQLTAATIGAVGGAVAAATGAIVSDRLAAAAWLDYTAVDD